MKGRIVKGVGGLYNVSVKDEIYYCRARGIFRKRNIKPCIGDYVKITILNEEEKEGIIEEIEKRETELTRPKVSNVTQVLIVFSIREPKINLDILDRFIILAEEVGIKISICINKVKEEDIESREIEKIYRDIGYDVVTVTNNEKKGVDKVAKLLKGHTTVFAGPSGVGKSTIINKILGREAMETGIISEKIKRGKHTTRHSELIVYDENSFIVDSPGFTSLSLEHFESNDLKYYFNEFEKVKDGCKFLDCNHINETKCRVIDGIGKEINKKRYNRYVFLFKELENKKGGKNYG